MGRQVWSEAELEPTTSRQSVPQSEGRRKKKKGLAKIWNLVTRVAKHDNKREMDINGRGDDEPLAPPPPLTYLLSREGRHASSPALSTNTMRMSQSPVGLSPTTASTSHLPSSSSISRPSEQDSLYNQKSSGDPETRTVAEDRLSKNLHSMTSEPDMRQLHSQSPSSSPSHTPTPLTNHSGVTTLAVQPSSLTREKSLPPLPGQARERRPMDDRPKTVYTYEPRHPAGGSTNDLLPPQAQFRNGDARRQSFGGLTSRPNLDGLVGRHTAGGPNARASAAFPATYDEFGGSRRSLRLDSSSNRISTLQPAKRKSKFGLSSLFGRKEPQKNLMQENVAQQVPTFRRSGGSDGQDDNGYGGSVSRHSAFSGYGSQPGPGSRMSVTSRKALEELVAQDTEFVAYRYPSNDQNLDLLR